MFQKNVLEKIKINILGSLFFSKNRAVYGKIWKYFVQRGRPQTILLIRIATHTVFCVIIIAFPRQQRLHESFSIFRYAYITYLFHLNFGHRYCGKFWYIFKYTHSTLFPIIITSTHDINVQACVRMHMCVCVRVRVSYPSLYKNGPLQLSVNTYCSLTYTDVSYAFGMTPAASQHNTKEKTTKKAEQTN